MKKNYTYPTVEILPFCAVTALCGSGGDGFGGGEGGDAWESLGPRRTAPF